MKEVRGFIKKYFAVFLSLLIILSPVLASASEVTSVKTSSAYTTSAKYGSYIYYSVYNKLYRINTKTKKKQLILYKKSWWDISNITIYKGYIYCIIDTCYGTGDSYPYIYRVKTDGTKGKILDQGYNLVLYEGKLYYNKLYFKESNFYDTCKYYGIYKMNLNGSNKKSIKSGSNIYYFKIYKSNIYYKISNSIYKVGINGKNNKKLFSSSEKDIFSIYGGNIYYNKQSNIYKYNLSSKKSSKVISNASGFDVSNGYIYYITYNSSKKKESIYRSKISTGKKYFIISKKSIYNVHIEGDYILYYSPGPTQDKNTCLSIIKCNGKENTKLAYLVVS